LICSTAPCADKITHVRTVAPVWWALAAIWALLLEKEVKALRC
jgi:uncharacterized membrane protein YwzB